MRTAAYEIALFPGDGTGPEVLREGRRVLDALAEGERGRWNLTDYLGGGQYYQTTGREVDPESLEAARRADAILLGAVGWPGATLPNGDLAGGALVLGLRQSFDLFANVRPCKLYEGVRHRISGAFQQVWTPKNVDLVIVRENTEDLYAPLRGRLKRADETELTVDTRIITRKGAERVIRHAYELAQHRPQGAPEDGVKRLTCVDKSNVMEGCRFFRETFDRLGPEYPEIERDYAYVDAFTQWLIRNPEHYDVVVSTNLMGDIITDLASVLQGGMGFAAGGNLGVDHGMFEPVHGSSPKHAGRNVVNPFATFFAVEMMLRWLSERHHDDSLTRQADRLERSIAGVLRARSAQTYDQGGTVSTSGAGDRIVEAIRGLAA
ncbi:MAG: isocitrate/isopropylmalate dehydrogenase family protein [Thermoplasmata archaeon]|nr:isocitrate/isopropylmalate dehydrogenase family protein [Thermoplasmata archaeon]MCI4359029.1 isocitrate/isopropylmalate dehydrogenase family protein [Thermoplasmata archaeon]